MLESICAAPGTGKSFLLGAIADAWQGSGRQMFGLATTEELAARGLDLANPPDATTAEDWLESHRAQQATMEAARVGAGRYNA